MVKIHRIWFNTERMDREDHYKITLFSRPRVSIHVDEYIWSFIEENIVKPHKLMRSEKHGYLLDISFDQFDPAKHRYYPLSPYNGQLREGVKPDSANGPLLYRKMGMALRACGREILFSACNWGNDEVSRWIRSAGAHMYRSTGDINDSFRSFADIALSQIDNLAYSAPGCFNDIDMLTVGMYGRGNVGSVGCSDIDYKTQFALWCMFSSPLMLGGDLRCMNDFCLDLVKNERLIRINQDEESRPAFVATKSWNDKIVFAKLLSNNEIAILFVNFSESKCGVPFYFENIGISAASGYGLEMTDAFTGECIGVKKEFMQMHLEAHDCACFICKLKK